MKRGYFYCRVLHELLKGLFDRLFQWHVKHFLGWGKENKPNHLQCQMKIANKENSKAKNNQKLTRNCLIHQTQEEQMAKENCWLLGQSLLSENLQLPLNSAAWDRNFNNIFSSEKSCRCEGKLMDHSLTQRESKCSTDSHHRVQGDSYKRNTN